MKTTERLEAMRLRGEEGRSIREIATILGVARSSVSRWVRDVQLSDEQLLVLKRRNPIHDGQRAGAAAHARLSLVARRGYQEAGRARVAAGAPPQYIAGCMLYWAEGSKSRNAVRFVNSDPEMLRFFVDFLRRYFDVPDETIRVSCNLYADHADRVAEVEQFWLDTLELSAPSLLKSTVNHYSLWSLRKRRNALPYGTCRVVVNRTWIVQTIYGSIQELAGFEREDWLTA